MSIKKPLPIPAADVLLVNPATGKINTDWYLFLFTLLDRLNRLLTFIGAAEDSGTTVAALPSAVTAGLGARGIVTDATATTFHSTVAGGGSNIVPVYSDGANWLIG